METLHPQWGGYGYTWRSDLNAIQPEQYARSEITGPGWLSSPMYDLICRARNGEDDPWMRRRLEIGPDQRDFPILEEFFARGRPIISRSFSYSARTAILRKGQALSIPLQAIGAAGLRTTIRRFCGLRFLDYLWR